jgi:translocation and assembly module TamB
MHIEDRLSAGTLAIDASVRAGRAEDRGRLTLDLAHVDTGPTRNLSAHVQGSLEGRTLEATAHLEASGAGSLDVHASRVLLGGPELLSTTSWMRAKGAVEVDARIDLARAVSLLPAGRVPFTDAAGTVHLEAHLQRDDAGTAAPALTLEVTTDRLALSPGFQVTREIDGVLVHPAPPWRLAGVDFAVDASVSGASGATHLSVKARDAHGPLAQLDAECPRPPFGAVFGGGALLRELRTVPFDLHLSVPKRGLGTLPPILTQPYVSGLLDADVEVRGPVAAPTVDFAATIDRGRVSGALSRPITVDVRGKYDGARATASMRARSRDKEVLDVEGTFDGALAALLDGRGAEIPWTASATAHADRFPLGSVAMLDDKGIVGDLSGDVKLEDLHRNGRVDLALTVDGLAVGSVAYKEAHLKAKADGHVLDASVRVDQGDGFLQATAHGAQIWGAAVAPALDPSQPLQATLSSKNFRIAGALPFVASALDELDGRLDSDAHLELDPRARTAKGSGTLHLRRGTVEAVAGGGELHDMSADVTVAPDGTITLQKLTASGVTGRLEASGVAHLKGTSLQSAHAVVNIPAGAAVPVTAGGVEVGSVDGQLEATVGPTSSGRAVQVKVAVPRLDVRLPEGSTTNPQALGPMDARIRIGAHRGDPARFVLLPLDPSRAKTPAAGDTPPLLDVQTHFTRVHVVRGMQLAVDLTGQIDAAAGATTRVTGQIRLQRGGTLAVQGRTFVVESGTVTFVGADPSNPQVVVTADWASPDGTVVTATFVGPLKTGKVTLASEPQLPRDEIVQLLLFGSADGRQAQTPSSTTENSAIATAGGEAAQPLNHMLDQLGLGAVTANIDSSDAANPKPEVEVQIARDISLQLAVVLGQPPPGVNPDVTLLTLDWRFLSKWSLATTVGNAGSTIFELLWQKRY